MLSALQETRVRAHASWRSVVIFDLRPMSLVNFLLPSLDLFEYDD